MNGCDSVITLDLTINNSFNITTFPIACDSFVWAENGTTYYQSGSASVNYNSIHGCDSTISVSITINQSTSGGSGAVACDEYFYGPTEETFYSDTVITTIHQNSRGCDSTHTFSLSVYYSDSTTQVIQACDSYTWIDGVTYSSSNNTATHTLTNSSGICDFCYILGSEH